MLDVTFEFVGGPNDGRVIHGAPGQQSDAHRYYLFSHHGRIGQAFKVASEHAIQALASGEAHEESLDRFQQHYYVVTDRQEDNGEVRVRVEYAPELGGRAEKLPTATSDRSAGPAEDSGFRPHLLIASPQAGGTSPTEAVVLLIARDQQGADGLVLNCPLPMTIADVWEKLGQPPCENQQTVNLGGLEEGPLLAMHTDPGLADLQLLPGVFLATSPAHLDAVVRKTEQPFRLFVGVAHWSASELDEQLAQGEWLALPATAELLFTPLDEPNLWERALGKYTRNFFRALGVLQLPEDPSWN